MIYKYLTEEFLNKDEIGKYIEVLNRGYLSFAPMVITENFDESYTQVEEILIYLQYLDYDRLRVEVTNSQIDKLMRTKEHNKDFKYQLHFIRDRETLVNEAPKMFEGFKNRAKELESKGLWTTEQCLQYIMCCNDITKLFEEQLNNFYACVGDMGYHISQTDKEPQPEQEPRANQEKEQDIIPPIPDELKSDEAKKYFDKAIEFGLMDNNYKWLKGLQLLACFAREMSLKLGLNKAINRNGLKRISWKPFEELFKIKYGKLRLNYNDIQKTGQDPSDAHLIDKIFK